MDQTISVGQTEIGVRGRAVTVRSALVADRTVVTSGSWVRLASVYDEEFIGGEAVPDPPSFIAALRKTALRADIFTFAQRLPDTTPRYLYHHEWDNPAIIPITTFSDWWERRVESSVRRAVRKATKLGVQVKREELDDAFLRGIVDIYNETPIRQGRAFWHYQKSPEAVRRENATYPDRTVFLGAYHQGELIGFLRIIQVDTVASIVQILSKLRHSDKRPTNALIAKAVELCAETKRPHLQYCSYIYNDPDSSLTEFKRRNGFQQVLVPRYYVPLTATGRLALRLGLHRGLVHRIPRPLLVKLLRLRTAWYARQSKTTEDAGSD